MPSVIAIVAHPDDIEFVMAGTLMRLGAAGWDLHYMNVANGCCGSTTIPRDELAKIRREESIDACKVLGATYHDSLCDDLDVFYDRDTLARLAAVVREVAPRIVLTHALADYMEDHMNTARLAVSAAFTRGMPNFPTDPPRPIVDGDVTLYHAQPHGNCDPTGNPVQPGWFVDITGLQDKKATMLACHRSQQAWLDQSQGLNSYIQTMHDLNHELGRLSGRFEYAEGFRRHHWPGFCAEGDDPLADALGEKICHVVKR